MGRRGRRLSTKLVSFIVIFIFFIAACNGNPAPEKTPTVQPSPTMNETEIALLWTDTPSPSPSSTWTASPTITPSVTNSPTGTPLPTETNTPTNTATDTPLPTDTVTASPSATDTSEPTATNTTVPTDTSTPRPTLTDTPEPTLTNTVVPTDTSTPRPTVTNTSEPTSTNTAVPTDTFTPQPTETNTPEPTNTNTPQPTDTQTPQPSSTPQPRPQPTATLIPSNTTSPTPSLTQEPSATMTLTPTVTETRLPTATHSVTVTQTPTVTQTITPFQVVIPTSTPTGEGTGAPRVDLTPDFGTPVDTVVAGDATVRPDQVDTSGTSIPVASPTEENFPTVLPTPGGAGPAFTPTRFVFGTSSIAFQGPNGGYTSLNGEQQGFGALAYDVGAGGGAYFYSDGLNINGTYLTTSPSSDVGWPDDKQVTEMRWSPNGRYLAFVIRGNDPSEVDYGVWVYDASIGVAHQIMRNDWDYREARHISWSPNSTVVLITLDHPNGPSHTFLPAGHDVHVAYDQEEFSDAAWSRDSGSIVVSGIHHDGSARLGRVLLDEAHTYVPVMHLPTAEIGVARAAIEGNSGQILFLGGPSQTGPFRLYQIYPSGAPTAISSVSISGNIVSWEWNDSRTSLLLVIDTVNGRQAWQVDASGVMTNITPPGGITGEVRWQ